MTPQRIQLSRRKGWRMPENTVKVSRPSRWGNLYTVDLFGRERAVANYRLWLVGMLAINAIDLSPLRGKNLACWCKPCELCHADVLMEFANNQEAAES